MFIRLRGMLAVYVPLELFQESFAPMKRIFLFFACVFTASLSAQSLTVHSMDSVAYVNSHTGSLAEGHIALLNTSGSTQSYILKRIEVGNTGLVDSNYFCWDLCYPTWVNQSQGSVQVNAGAVAYDFSGYAYVMDTAANGQDTVWYRFENVADTADFLDVPMIFAFSQTFGQGEPVQIKNKIYPNPSHSGRVTIEFAPLAQVGRVDVLDMLGRVRAQVLVPAYANKVVWNVGDAPKGIYILRRSTGTMQENVGKVLIQ